MFPVMLSLRGRRCLVVGGGAVAVRKVESLLGEGAEVTVVAPALLPRLEELAEAGRVGVERRRYRAGEAGGWPLVFAATDDRAVNRQVFEDAEASGVWVNVADDPELCSFHLPARVLRGGLQLTVSSAGGAPFVVRRLRQVLERRLGAEWGEWLEAAARFRAAVRARRLDRGAEEASFDRFFAATVDADRLRARVPGEEEAAALLIADGGAPAVATAAGPRCCGRRPDGPGMVSLVGAGPGDPLLLTLRGRRRLLAADAIVYDRLAEPAMPGDLPAHVELHCVGKTAGHHPTPQEAINETLVRLAREGKRVVRLKGGDPYVFGRGGEEAEALHAAGIPFEVVPGVTSGVAAPACAGIPVTHRREAVGVTFLTAHEAVKAEGDQLRWDVLAQNADVTLVGYMGVTSLPAVAANLVRAGMDPETPAALIERGATSAQRVVRSTLRELPLTAAGAGIRPPALFVIGPTVRHAETLEWYSARPLAGERLLMAVPGGSLADCLEVLGAELVEARLPLTPGGRVAAGALPLSGCVLRTPAEAELLDDERGGPGWEGEVVAWCLGADTAARARALGWPAVEEVAAEADLPAALQGRRHAPAAR